MISIVNKESQARPFATVLSVAAVANGAQFNFARGSLQARRADSEHATQQGQGGDGVDATGRLL